MSSLFIPLYLDEDVSILVAKLLRARAFDATTAVDEGQLGRSDPEQLAYATGQERALLTHNRVDFESLAHQYVAAGQTHHGIIIAVRRPPHEITRRLLILLNSVTADEMQDQL
jgi:predicted nuclease of predicted toxin-antitoxin system